jgi:hypothetical protein
LENKLGVEACSNEYFSNLLGYGVVYKGVLRKAPVGNANFGM